MKTIFLSLSTFISALAIAQVSIPASHDMQTGTLTYSYVNDPAALASLSPGPAGSDQSWDFSQYQGVTSLPTTILKCPGDVNCSDYPAAELMSKLTSTPDTSYTYYDLTNNELSRIGDKATQNGTTTFTIYDNPKLVQKYPITYLQTFTDTWDSHSNPAGTTESGSETINVDAFGTLKTPLGTFVNTLRVKRVQNFTVTLTSSPPMSIVSESYTWISPNYAGTLLEISFDDVTIGGTTSQSKSLNFGKNDVLSADEVKANEQAEIYPNPSSDFISLKTNDEVTNLQITDMEGKMVLQSSKSDKINITKLPTGIYILKAELKNGKSVMKKFIKKP